MDENNMFTMPVAPFYGGNNGGFGNLFGGDSGAWLLLVFIMLFGGFGNGYGGMNGGGLYPWMNQAEITQAGFNSAALTSQLGDIGNSINNGFSSMEVANCNRAMDAMQTAYNNQIASMNTSFAMQNAINGGFNSLQSQLAQCCCENRLATANTQNLILQENCADRAALSDGIRDIITNQTMNTQKILDTMCADKIDAKNEKIIELQNQVNMMALAASQTAQTAALIANNNDQTEILRNATTTPTT